MFAKHNATGWDWALEHCKSMNQNISFLQILILPFKIFLHLLSCKYVLKFELFS